MLAELDVPAIVRTLQLRTGAQTFQEALDLTMNTGVEGARVNAFLRGFGLSQLEGAKAVGVGPTAHSWFSHGRLNKTQTARSLELVGLLCRAAEVFGSDDAVKSWLREHPKALHGESPLALLLDGKLSEFNTVLGRIEHGVFS